MNIEKIGESKPDREQPKAAPKRRAKAPVSKEASPEKDKPPDDGNGRRVDVVA